MKLMIEMKRGIEVTPWHLNDRYLVIRVVESQVRG